MSDRDKKLITFILTVAVIVLPYFLYIKDKRVETQRLTDECVSLQQRYDYLNELNQNRDFYEKEIARYNEEIEKIIALFPADIRQEKTTMLLLNTEYEYTVPYYDIETGEKLGDEPLLRFSTVSFGDNVETPINASSYGAEETGGNVEAAEAGSDADTGYVALSNITTLSFEIDNVILTGWYEGDTEYPKNGTYEIAKELLQGILDYEDPMIFTDVSLEFDPETGTMSGTMSLAQYAVSGDDREFIPLVIWPPVDERGNEEYGIFGPSNELWTLDYCIQQGLDIDELLQNANGNDETANDEADNQEDDITE